MGLDLLFHFTDAGRAVGMWDFAIPGRTVEALTFSEFYRHNCPYVLHSLWCYLNDRYAE